MMFYTIIFIFVIFIVGLNILAWCLPAFCDWYTRYVTPLWYNSLGRLTNIFTFSVGEVLLIVFALLILTALVMGILLIFLRRKKGYVRVTRIYYRVFVSVTVATGMIMTLNCTMLYHCTDIDANPDRQYREYSLDELELARNYIVSMCNEYSGLVSRDENGNVIYDGDMQEVAKAALHGIADIYPKLSGYYPDVKNMMFSDILSQARIAGYYFPFSMEANCNADMYITNYPEVYCHELSHLHGYIYEDEANFISFLACTSSDDVFFAYSGYIDAYNYINNAYYTSLDGDTKRYNRQADINDKVKNDNIFLTADVSRKIEETAVFSSDTVEAVMDDFVDTSLKLNGEADGIAIYSGVVDLLLQYYDGTLY